MKTHCSERFLYLTLPILVCTALFLLLSSCGGSASSGDSGSDSSSSSPYPQPPTIATPLQASDVQSILQAAIQSVNVPIVAAVTDRLGNMLGIACTTLTAPNRPFSRTTNPCTPATGPGNFGTTPDSQNLAVALARTAAFFSNSQAPLSSRTVRFISGIHFPPGVINTPNAALYGIENTNRGCSFNTVSNPTIPPATLIDGTSPGLGIITGKADTNDSQPFAVNPGGVPLYASNFVLLGGIGVVAGDLDVAEYAAFSGSLNTGHLPLSQVPPPGVVVINGVTLPFVNNTTIPPGVSPNPAAVPLYMSLATNIPPAPLPPNDRYLVGPKAGIKLSLTDVNTIVQNARATAMLTRAQIRLPIGARAQMMISVSDLDGTLLAVYRMTDATVFSIDVSVAKARNVVYFSNPGGLPGAYSGSSPGYQDLPGVPELGPDGTAVTNRTISFGAQPLFPPGINGSSAGPFFGLYTMDTAKACTQGSQPPNPNQNGIVFFPGSVPLYENGVLVGGLGVSGDGVDQDDFVTGGAVDAACGAGGPCGIPDFQAPTNIRADQVVIRNVRLPYLKFPRNPTD